jgi:hypothetical protein
MAENTEDRGSKVGTRLPFLWRPVRQVLGPPELLPAGGPALGGWTRPLDDLADRSAGVRRGIRRRVVRTLRESITCAMALVWVTLVGCALALGWRRPRRVLAVAAIFAVPWFFLALPADWVAARTWADFVAAGRWAMSAKLTATLLGTGLVVFHFVMALIRVPVAREQLPALCLEERLAQAEALLDVPVEDAGALRAWIARTRAWSAAVETELRELHSPAVAYAFRRVTPGTIVRYAHRYDAVHDGWLNMLSWRRDVLADLLDPRGRRPSPRRAPSEFRHAAA